MIDAGLVIVLLVYLVASLLLFGFGANLARFAVLVVRGRRPRNPVVAAVRGDDDLPRVTIQLPIYNELYVSERVIAAACAVDYPRGLLQIQVLDDSTDETVSVVARAVDRHRSQGIDIEHIRRLDRTGYKAGALAEGLRSATGEFVAIFDADFVPPPDFLRRTLGEFDADVAFVQARWGHLNRDFSWLTRLQALAIDGHFLVEQSGRGVGNYWFNFNGTAGIWRVEAIADAGGWRADTLTEDLDLSYRAHLRGWRGRYLDDLVVPGEVPAQMASFRRQQHRWARGSMECAIRLLPQVWHSSASVPIKFQASVHLMAYGIHLVLLLLALIYPLVVEAGARFPGASTLYGAGYMFAAAALAPGVFFAVGQHRAGRNWVREIPRIAMMTVFGSGLMVNSARACLQIFTKPNPEFERTAKFGASVAAGGAADWSAKRYQLDVDTIIFTEVAVACYCAWSAVLAARHDNWGIMLYASLFAAGLFAVVTATLSHSLAVRRNRVTRAEVIRAERETWDLLIPT